MEWPRVVKTVSIQSSFDGSQQPAMWYAPKRQADKVPLLVGLHTWGGNYKQEGSIGYGQWCIENQWAFIHPDFRGPNKNPAATGSDAVLSDILDAVEFAKTACEIDANNIFLVGVSGGGYTALLAASRQPEIWRAVSVWCAIVDLRKWHSESSKLDTAYAEQIAASCGGVPGASDSVENEYAQRSPITHLASARDVLLDINAGIHDGHTGSVPVSHSFEAFNALAKDENQVGEEDINHIVQNEKVPAGLLTDCTDPMFGEKKLLFRRKSGNVRLSIFEGGHEIICPVALSWLADNKTS